MASLYQSIVHKTLAAQQQTLSETTKRHKYAMKYSKKAA